MPLSPNLSVVRTDAPNRSAKICITSITTKNKDYKSINFTYLHSFGLLQCPCCSLQPGVQRAGRREERIPLNKINAIAGEQSYKSIHSLLAKWSENVPSAGKNSPFSPSQEYVFARSRSQSRTTKASALITRAPFARNSFEKCVPAVPHIPRYSFTHIHSFLPLPPSDYS